MQVSANQKRRNYVLMLVDESGSMQRLRQPTINAVKAMIESVKSEAKTSGQETFLSLISFNNHVETALKPTDVSKLSKLSIDAYQPDGGTRMFDAIGEGMKLLQDQPVPAGTDVSYLVMVFTDGEENGSRTFSAYDINQSIRRLQGTDRWSFTFQVPRGFASNLSRQFGVAADNIREWDQTEKGVQELAVTSSAGLSNFYQARAKGETNTRSFYAKVSTDLGGLTKAAVQRALDNVSADFKQYATLSETRIDEFVETKTKRPYQTGSTFYQLMKPEKVQPQKQVLLIDKRDGKIYGGAGARDLIGLPDGQYARVTPGNHSDYEIFVQSTSTNRILPRGTKVLVRL